MGVEGDKPEEERERGNEKITGKSGGPPTSWLVIMWAPPLERDWSSGASATTKPSLSMRGRSVLSLKPILLITETRYNLFATLALTNDLLEVVVGAPSNAVLQ